MDFDLFAEPNPIHRAIEYDTPKTRVDDDEDCQGGNSGPGSARCHPSGRRDRPERPQEQVEVAVDPEARPPEDENHQRGQGKDDGQVQHLR